MFRPFSSPSLHHLPRPCLSLSGPAASWGAARGSGRVFFCRREASSGAKSDSSDRSSKSKTKNARSGSSKSSSDTTNAGTPTSSSSAPTTSARTSPIGTSCTLIVSTDRDVASCTLAEALLKHSAFRWVPDGSGHRSQSLPGVFLCSSGPDRRLLDFDNIDDWWLDGRTDRTLNDVIFLSKHASASAQPSLTVHPIGNPRRDLPATGSIAGQISPPSPRLTSLLRALRRVRDGATGLSDYDVTLEATHHGPTLRTPALFAEIGSSEKEWTCQDAGTAWAEALWIGLQTPPSVSPIETCAPIPVVSLGGNHYMSHMNDLVFDAHPSLRIGHMLANYTLQDAPTEEVEFTLRNAFESTAAAYPEASSMIVLLLKKKFRAADRKALQSAIERIRATWSGPTLHVAGRGSEASGLLKKLGAKPRA